MAESPAEIAARLRERTKAVLPNDWQAGRRCPECGSAADRQKCLFDIGPSCPRHDPDAYDDSPYRNEPDEDCHTAAALIERQAAEITRLQSGGCARDQTTTQYCAEAAAFAAEVAELRAEVERLRGETGWRPIDALDLNGRQAQRGVIVAAPAGIGRTDWVVGEASWFPEASQWHWAGGDPQDYVDTALRHPPRFWQPLPAPPAPESSNA